MTLFLNQDYTFYRCPSTGFDAFHPLEQFDLYKFSIRLPQTDIIDTNTKPTVSPLYTNGNICKKIPIQLNMSHTYEICAGSFNITHFRSEFLYHIVHDLNINYIPKFYDDIFTEPFQMCNKDVHNELEIDNLYNWHPVADRTNCDNLCQQRMIQYFEHLGYNGFNYINVNDSNISYIVFRPEHIMRMDNTSKFLEHNSPLQISHNYEISHYREMSNFEKKLLNEAESLHNISKNLKTQMWKNICLQPSVIKFAIPVRKYYTKLLANDILPSIENIGTQQKYGYHGLYTHTFQVAQFAIELALSVWTDPLPVILGAALHDIARTHDDDDYAHGPQGAKIARDFLNENYKHLFPGTIDKIVYAIENHTIGEKAPDLISACVWDADRIRLSWEMGYDEKFFNTEYGKYIASLPRSNNEFATLNSKGQQFSQKKYIENQLKFLRSHNIKTY